MMQHAAIFFLARALAGFLEKPLDTTWGLMQQWEEAEALRSVHEA